MGDYRTTTGEAAPIAPEERKRRKGRRRLWIGGGALFGAVLLTGVPIPYRVTATGYVASENYAEIRPAVEGVVAEIRVGSGRRVERDTLLARLDDREQVAQIEEIRGLLRKLEAQFGRRKAEIAEMKRAMESAVAVARLREKNAAGKLARSRELLERGLTSAATTEDFSLQQELAAAELAALLERDLTLPERELESLRFEIEAQTEGVARIEAQRKKREIRAPFDGLVVRYEFSVGELVRPDMVLFEMFGGERQMLKLRIPERHATRIVPGQSYRARLASYRDLRLIRFDGHIEALRDIIQADGVRTYRTAYASFDAGSYSVPPGTTAEAKIHTGNVRLWQYILGFD